MDELSVRANAVADELYREFRGCEPNTEVPEMSQRAPRPYERKGRTSPVILYVRSLGEEFRTAGEVAQLLGFSPSHIRKISDEVSRTTDTIVPSYKAKFGQHRIRVYTPEDIEILRDYLAQRFQLEKNDG